MEVWGWRGTLNSPRNTKGEEREKMSHRGGGRRPDADPSFSVASSHCASESHSTCYVMTDYLTHCRHHDENWKSDLFQSVWFPFFWRGEEALIYYCLKFFFPTFLFIVPQDHQQQLLLLSGSRGAPLLPPNRHTYYSLPLLRPLQTAIKLPQIFGVSINFSLRHFGLLDRLSV